VTAAEVWSLVAAAVLVVLAAMFAAAEAALAHVTRVRVEELIHEGRRGALRLGAMVADAPRYLAGLLLLRTLCEVVAVTLVAVVCDRHLGAAWQTVLLAGVGMTVVNFTVVGVGGGTLGTERVESVALRSSGPVRVLVGALGPVPGLFIRLARVVVPGRQGRDRSFTSQAELRHLVDQASERRVIESGEQQMIQSVFDFGDTIVREVMVPRTDMVWIERTKTVRQALSLALRSGFSRIPVVGDNEDDVVGIAYIKDLARRVYDDEAAGRDRLDDCMRPASLVPESKPVDELLREMQTSQVHLAIVIDEYGGTAGLVTMEDVIEEIVGEIVDEYDREKPRIETLDDGSVRVNARVPIDDVEELFGVHFDVDGVETVGGLLASELGRVPIPGTTVTVQSLTFTAEAGTGRRHRVGTVLIRKAAAPAT